MNALEAGFLFVVVGCPIAICVVAVIGAHFHDRENIELFDDRPAPATELHARRSEVEEMLETVNRSRRARGAPARTLQQVGRHQAGSLRAVDGDG